jgi:lipopolysaccharide biosynthesis glycosyltransferase
MLFGGRMNNNPNAIDVAFCFDENVWMYASVAITSLLSMSDGKCEYNIYCIVSPNINKTMQNILELLFKKHLSLSSIEFFVVTANELCNVKSQDLGMYYRLLLCQIFPEIDKIIYIDIDTVFNSDLRELNSIDVSKYYIAGVKDANICNSGRKRLRKLWIQYDVYNILNNEQYINSGVLIMNLKKLRQDNIDKKWLKLAKEESFPFHDQDIINISCVGNVLLLPDEYNSLTATNTNLKIFHFAGADKPWIVCKEAVKYSELWWYYASQIPFYLYFLKSMIQEQYEKRFRIFPKWLGKCVTWFIFRRAKRHSFFNKYVDY